MTTTISPKLLSRIGKYSVLTGASLAVLSGCGKDAPDDPLITYTDINPDISLVPPVNTTPGSLDLEQLIDLNDDGIDDVSIRIASYNLTYNSYTFNLGNSYADGENGASILARYDEVDFGPYTGSYYVAKGLSSGDPIDAAQTVWAGYGYLGVKGTYYSEPVNFGDFLGGDKFLGVRFEVGGNTHYGWVRIGVAGDGKSLKIKDYAYHTTPDTAIDAGAE
jgi:hypothetical protein